VSLWFLWLAFVALLTARYFRWEIDYFSRPGPIFRVLLLCALPVLCAAGPLYAWIRGPRLRRYEFPALAALCAVCALVCQPLAALAVALLFLTCVAVGCVFARVARIPLVTPIDTVTLGFAFGCALLIPLLFVLGLLHLYYLWVFAVLLVAPLIFVWREVLTALRAVRAILATPAPDHPLAGIVFIFAIVAAISALAVALSPSVAFDPLADHLANARYYVTQHGLEILPSQDNSYFPQGFETLMALAWSIGGQPAAQLISPLFWALSLLTLFAIARACGLNAGAAFTGLIVAAMMPFAHWTGANSKNDWTMVFFGAAALLVFIRWLESRNRSWLPLGALFLGSSFAVKHVALFAAVPLVCFFLYACRRIRPAFAFCVIMGASCLYWHARTTYLTGNPVYPTALERSVERPVPRNPVYRKYGRLARLLPHLGAPIRRALTFESPLPNPAGIAILAFLPFVFPLLLPKTPARRACLIFCAVYLAYWVAMVPMVRYAMLPLTLVAILLIGKAIDLFNNPFSGRLVRISIAGAVVYALAFASLGIAIIEINAPMLAFFAHRTSAGQYLDQALETHRSLAWLAANHPDASIYAVNNCSRAYAPDPAKFYCTMGETQRPDFLARSQYLVLPHGATPNRAGDALFSDPSFTVWRLK